MKIAIAVAVLLLILLVVKAKGQSSSNFSNIDVTEFKNLMKDSNTVILDVRTPGEISAGKIAKAKEIDFMNPSFGSRVDSLDKEKTYLVYCRSGNRSSKACNVMSSKGFTKLYNLSGGYGAWSRGK